MRAAETRLDQCTRKVFAWRVSPMKLDANLQRKVLVHQHITIELNINIHISHFTFFNKEVEGFFIKLFLSFCACLLLSI